MMKVMSPRAQRRLQHLRSEHRRQRRLRAGQAPAVGGVHPAGRRHDHGRHSPGLRAARWRSGGGGAGERLVDDRCRPGGRPLCARHARSPIPWRSGGGTAGILRADARDADVLRHADRRAARHRVDGRTTGSFRTSGRCTSGSRRRFSTSSTTCRRIRRCRSRGCARAASSSPTSCARSAFSASVCWTAQPVDDTMLTRLVQFQLGRSTPSAARPPDLDPRLVSDLRIAENVMGTIVGAIAGQEEATCRVIDSLIRLQAGRVSNQRADGLPLRQLFRGASSWPSTS